MKINLEPDAKQSEFRSKKLRLSFVKSITQKYFFVFDVEKAFLAQVSIQHRVVIEHLVRYIPHSLYRTIHVREWRKLNSLICCRVK